MRYARTLVEAHLYISLTLSADGSRGDAARNYQALTALIEGPNAWTLRFEEPGGGAPPIEICVRYETEAEARHDALTFGWGASEVIDAGQWLQISAVYARRALREGLFFATDPTDGEKYQGIVSGWKLARDTTSEAAKFLDDDDEMPDSAFWTTMGMSARRESPERFTRERLDSDYVFCQTSLDDFLRLHAKRWG
jgi:hypothetical protein